MKRRASADLDTEQPKKARSQKPLASKHDAAESKPAEPPSKRRKNSNATKPSSSEVANNGKSKGTGSKEGNDKERKARLSRKSCAYKKAYSAAKKAGEAEETARAKGKEAS